MGQIDAETIYTDAPMVEYYTKHMTIGEYLDRYTEEGCPWEGADDETD